MDRALDGMNMSRWDKFGTKYDRWMQGHKYNALPGWKIVTLISSKLSSKMKYDMAEDVFADLASAVEEFKGLDYDAVGKTGVQLKIKQNVTV